MKPVNFSRSILAVALYSVFSIASAQVNLDVATELKSLKDRITELESQVKNNAQGVDPAEFNRVRVKTEALEDNYESQGFKGLKINGFMDPAFISNKARKSHGINFLNNFDGRADNDAYTYDNSYLGNLWLDFQKDLDGGVKWRFTMAPHKSASSGYNLGSIVHEASVSIPLGDLSTRLIAGQIPDWSGYEYIPATQNKLITHNMLFDFTMPNFYQGVGMEIADGKWLTKVLVGNMNATRNDVSNDSRLLTMRVDYSKGEYDGFGGAFQNAKVAGSNVFLAEVDGYFVRGPLSMFGQISNGRVAGGAGNGGTPTWQGASGLVAYKLTPQLELIGRLDYIKNNKNGGGTLGAYNSACSSGPSAMCPDGNNGFGYAMEFDGTDWVNTASGKGVNRTAFSLGINYQYLPNVVFKAEARLDNATGNVFYYQADGSYRKNNRLIGLSTVVSF